MMRCAKFFDEIEDCFRAGTIHGCDGCMYQLDTKFSETKNSKTKEI